VPITEDEVAIPMVCFCDIPLSQITNHSKQYGNYGIGLEKKWGKKRGVTPVTYYHDNSNHILAFLNAAQLIKNELNKIGAVKPFNEIMYSTWFYKPYAGKMWRDGSYTEDTTRFYDEREWRFIPTLESMFTSEVMKYSYYDDEVELIKTNLEYKCRINQELSDSFKLEFKPSDIKYIIVEKESEILEMVEKIKRIKERFSEDDKLILITRIISMESIKADF